jgi:hypothetical protein
MMTEFTKFEEQFRKKIMRGIAGLEPSPLVKIPTIKEPISVPPHQKDFSATFVQKIIDHKEK